MSILRIPVVYFWWGQHVPLYGVPWDGGGPHSSVPPAAPMFWVHSISSEVALYNPSPLLRTVPTEKHPGTGLGQIQDLWFRGFCPFNLRLSLVNTRVMKCVWSWFSVALFVHWGFYTDRHHYLIIRLRKYKPSTSARYPRKIVTWLKFPFRR